MQELKRLERVLFCLMFGTLPSFISPLSAATPEGETAIDKASVLQVGVSKEDDFDVTDFDISPDGSLLAIACDDNQVRLWNLRRREWVRQWKASDEFLAAIAFHPNGRQIATAADDEEIAIWDVAMEGGGQRLKGATTFFAMDLQFARDGNAIFVLDDDGLRACDNKTGKEIWQAGSNAPLVDAMAQSPDGKTIVFGGNDIFAVAASDGGGTRELHWIDTSVRAMAYSPDGKTLLVAETTCRQSRLVFGDPATGEVIHSIESKMPRLHFTSVAFSPDGKVIAAGAEPGYIRMWDAESGKLCCSLATKHRAIDRLQFTPDGRFLITAGVEDAGQLMVWDVAELLEHARATPVREESEELP